MWVAREENGLLRLYTKKPYRYDCGIWRIPNDGDCITISDEEYPQYKSIKWEDEPIEVELNRVNRVNYHFIQCDKCGKAFSYLPREVHSFTACIQPSSGYEEEFEYVNCPHCKSEVYI